ncbi:MAG: radical SAM protein [Chitinivibrionales bacterium]|nr:radical SAM protein [Chitinivibrionales bacterium]
MQPTHGPDYRRPPGLAGYTFAPSVAYAARDAGRLLSVRLETNTACNLRCRYCYAESGVFRHEVPYERLTRVVDEARDMGAQSVVVIGGGEPTLYSHFRDLIRYTDSRGLTPVVFTNGLLVTPELAQFLYEHNASVMGKLDSFDGDIQDFLAGMPNAHHRIQQGLRNLIDAGFTRCPEGTCRLGVSFVTNRLNLGEIETIWHFCRENRIFPNMEILTPTGRARETLAAHTLTVDEIRPYKLALLELDRRCYGYDWLPYTPLAASGCLQHLYSLYITMQGDARPCAPTKLDEHPALSIDGAYPYNVNRMTLRQICESDLFTYIRSIDKHLQGKCHACRHGDECIGCRGYAFAVGVNQGKSPLEALAMECAQCFK